jgi:AcrR family transcriptional regulator
VIDKTPSERRYEKTRQGILSAARTILLENGIEALSMRTLADKVDYSPAALYKYFANKEEIIEALRQEAWELMANFEPDIPPGLSMADMFVLSGQNYVKFATQYPEHYMLIMSTTDTGPENMEEFKQSLAFVDLLQFTEAAVASGEFVLPEGYTPTHFALLAWFVVHGVSLLKLTMMSKCQDEFEEISVEVMSMIKEVFVEK